MTDKADVVEALNAHRGWDIAAEDVCLTTDPDFPDVAVVGVFADDRGCMLEAILVDGSWLAVEQASQPVLAARGWPDLDDRGREALALAWAEFGVFAYYGIAWERGDAFARADAPAYSPPSAHADGAGGVVVTLWRIEPQGSLPQTEYALWQVAFDGDGRQTGTERLDGYVVVY
ncbi:MAG: hypothetical protein R3F55_13605 [Alphaproteobacteria bacterium]